MIKYIKHLNQLYAIIIKANHHKGGIEFLTPSTYSQQLAYMCHPKGKNIQPHVHNPVHRDVVNTLEVLYLKKGKVKIDFYTQEKKYFETVIIETGDVILLAAGGHGFEMLEESELIEVKQGPYASDKDKTRFEPKNTT